MRSLLIAAVVALALGVGGWRVLVADDAPSVDYTLLDGSKGNLAALRGKVVLVNFWATNCEPCVREMPQFAALQEKFKARGYETLAVAMRYDPPALVIAFAERHNLPFGVVIDNTGAVARGFNAVNVTPTSVLIDRHGQIVRRFVGEADFAVLNILVEQLLAKS